MRAQPILWEEKEERLIRYLLGTASPEEEAEIEESLFVEPGLHDELLATTDDLIRAYLVGKLPADDRKRFETHFLASARRRERFEFLKDVLATIRDVSGRARPALGGVRRGVDWRNPWLALAALLVVAAGLYVALLGRQPREERRALQPVTPEPRPTLAPEATVAPVQEAHQTLTPSAPPRPEAVVRLPTAEGPVDVALARETRLVRLEVPLVGARHPTYDAEIRDSKGDSVWRASALVPRAPGEPLVLSVPATVLVADAYELRVGGEQLRDAPPEAARPRTYTLRIARSR
jgi:hypothetical protein